MKVLIVDDNQAARRLLGLYLAGYGTLVSVHGGSEAIETFSKAVERSDRFDLICLDYAMPGINGLEVLKTVRKIEEDNGIGHRDRTRIIMTSAVDEPSEIMKAYDGGCDSYMVRPDRKDNLLKEMDKLGLLHQKTA